MDQRASVEQDIKDILETRLEIGRKIQLIDEQARYELENMKSNLSGLVGAVTETGKDFIDQSTRTLNPVRQMNVRPWVALAGMVLVGFVIGMFEKKFRRERVYPYYPPKAHGVPVMPSESEKKDRETESGVYPYFPVGHQQVEHQKADRVGSSFVSDLLSDVNGTVRGELGRSKDAVGYAFREFARDMAKEIVPAILRSIAPTVSRGFRR